MVFMLQDFVSPSGKKLNTHGKSGKPMARGVLKGLLELHSGCLGKARI